MAAHPARSQACSGFSPSRFSPRAASQLSAARTRPAAASPSLGEFVSGLEWMNPIYAKLRKALIANTTALDAWKDITPSAKLTFLTLM